MGLATIDPHSQKEHTEIHNIPKFGVNQASFDWRYSDLKTSKWHPDAVWGVGHRPAIHFFVNFDIFKWLYLAYFWVYFHQTWGFCKACIIGLHFMTMWINSS